MRSQTMTQGKMQHELSSFPLNASSPLTRLTILLVIVVRSSPIADVPRHHPGVLLEVVVSVKLAKLAARGDCSSTLRQPADVNCLTAASGESPGDLISAFSWEPLGTPTLAAPGGQKPNPLSEPPRSSEPRTLMLT